MSKPIRILLQTTIGPVEDDWNINRFSLVREHLSSLTDDHGRALCQVSARDRETNADGNDKLSSTLDQTDFDELWLFAVDQGNGLTVADCQGITRFRQRGGGIFTTRDHQDLGSSLCTLGGVGQAHFFHTRQKDPDESRQARDDEDTPTISWPNYHSGNNGDYQKVTAVEPIHELLSNSNSSSTVIQFFPAHPHEGDVGVPNGEKHARVIATGLSQVTHRPFNLIVAFERMTDSHGNVLGRAIAQSSFHHLVDYNWDISKGCPSFVLESPGNQVIKQPEKLDDVKAYVSNVARWLVGRDTPN
jgi:hypothetical protein